MAIWPWAPVTTEPNAIQGLLRNPGRLEDGDAGRDQAGFPQARPQVPPRRQQARRRRSALQGHQRSQRGAEGPGEARRLRPGRPGLQGRARISSRRRTGTPASSSAAARRRAAASPARSATAASTPATSSSRCSAPAPALPARAPRRSASMQGEDHHAKVLIDLEDAYRGAERSISLRVPKEGADGRVTLEERRLDVHIPQGHPCRPAPAPVGPGRAGQRRRAGRRSLPRDRVQAASALSPRRRRSLRRSAAGAVGSRARRERRRRRRPKARCS